MEPELAETLDILGLVEYYVQPFGAITTPKTIVEVVPYSQSGKRYACKHIPMGDKNPPILLPN